MNYSSKKPLNMDEKLSPEQRLWKYMSFTKFMSLLETRSLFFCKADKFEDVFEGKIPTRFFYGWAKDYEELFKEIHEKLKERVFINCWSLNDEESYAMWKIYASKNDGVCVQTTIDRLQRAFINPNEKPRIVKVRYIDYKKDRINLEKFNTYEFYAYKSKVYEYEKEVRAILLSDGSTECMNLFVDLEILIDNIYIHPAASEWFVILINKILNTYNINKEVLHSSIKIQK
jgi:hypothetical protein